MDGCALLLALVALAEPASEGRSYKLTPPAVLQPGADVVHVVVSADQQWIAYITNDGTSPLYSLYCVPSDRSQPPRHLAGLASPFYFEGALQITPDDSHVLYLDGPSPNNFPSPHRGLFS